jgi:hypothetical protein
MNYAVIAAGNYAFRAIAYDNVGAPGPSPTVNLAAGTTQTNIGAEGDDGRHAGSMTPGGPVTLTATASDDDGTIASVKFYEGSTLLATVTAAPYTYVYNTTTAKIYRFHAVRTDNLGLTSPSPEVPVSVGSSDQPSRRRSRSPRRRARSPRPGTVTLNATASDDDGTIQRVSFFVNGNKIVDVTGAAVHDDLHDDAAAIYKFTAQAVDDKNLATTTADVNVSVGQTTNIAPKVSLSVSSTQITFPGTVVDDRRRRPTTTARSRACASTRTAAARRRDDAPYTFRLHDDGPGVYKFKAIAIDNRNASTSTAEIDVTSGNAQQLNKKPERVAVAVRPRWCMAPATMTLSVSASDTDGTMHEGPVLPQRREDRREARRAVTRSPTRSTRAGRWLPRRRDRQRRQHQRRRCRRSSPAQTRPPSRSAATPTSWRLLNQATFGASQAEAAKSRRPAAHGVDQRAVRTSRWRRLPGDPLQQDPAQRDGRLHDARPAGPELPGELAAGDLRARPPVARDDAARPVHQRRRTADHQLRQRVAWALSQILVISGVEQDCRGARDGALPADHVRGGVRQLRDDPQAHHAVAGDGQLARRGQQRPARPDARPRAERELRARDHAAVQHRLVELKIDGTPLTDALGQEIPTYDQDDIKQFARIFTGYT